MQCVNLHHVPMLCVKTALHMQVVEDMHGYAMSKDDFEYVLDVTRFKSKADWAADPYKGVPTKVKSAFTRCVVFRRLLRDQSCPLFVPCIVGCVFGLPSWTIRTNG